jgi:hypothetical protein
MFALPLAHPLHHALTSHVFGRLAARTKTVGLDHVLPSLPPPAGEALEEYADEMDLAQRVRDLGEW